MWRKVIFCLSTLTLIVTPMLNPARSVANNVNVGYAGNGGETSYEDQVDFAVNFDLDYATTHGAYLGLTLPLDLGDFGKLRLDGSITIPMTSKVESSLANPPGTHDRDWRADTTWGTIDGLFLLPVGAGCSTVLGFRWDNWQTGLNNPTNVRSSGLFAPTDTADVAINLYLPLVGLVTEWPGFSFGVTAAPVIRGNVRLRETLGGVNSQLTQNGSFDGGYYFEISTEYSTTEDLISYNGFDMGVSLFAKFVSLRATGAATWQSTGGIVTVPKYTPISFRRNMFVFGGTVSMGFLLPSRSDIF